MSTTAAEKPGLPGGRQSKGVLSHFNLDGLSRLLLLLGITALLAVFVAVPLLLIGLRSVTDDGGAFVGVANFVRYFRTPALLHSLLNTLIVGLVTVAGVIALAFPFAFAVTRSCVPFRRLFLALSMLPLFAPTMLYGLALIYLFGKQGLVTQGFFGRLPLRLDIHLYGLTGIILSEILATFPVVTMVLTVALSHTDRRLYEAAQSLGASAVRTFFTVTLPGCWLGMLSSAAIAFIFSTTDFGAAKVVGRQTSVLATDIYQQLQKTDPDLSLTAAVSLVLLIPSAIACGLEMFVRRRQAALLTSRSVPLQPQPRPSRDLPLLGFCLLVVGAIVIVTFTPLLVSFVRNWPYSLDGSGYPGTVFTLRHYTADLVENDFGGISAFADTLLVAALTAAGGAVLAFVTAYLVDKTKIAWPLRLAARVLSMLPLGLPGLVLGLSYSLMLSQTRWGPVPSPVSPLYGTIWIIVACNIVHFLGVGFLTATTALKQLDDEFEQVAASLGVSAWTLFFKVTLPICLPAILEMAVYFFVSATTTVSAVVFLDFPQAPLASIAVVKLDSAGLTQAATAMCSLIFACNVAVRLMLMPVRLLLERRRARQSQLV